MGREQCEWCGRLGQWVDGGEPTAETLGPHDRDRRHDGLGPPCRCKHVSEDSRRGAMLYHGCYWADAAWKCVSFGTAPPATDGELAWLEAAREEV